MEERNLFEKLVELSPGMEIWWDSSPVIFENWYNKLLARADKADTDILKQQIGRMFNPADPENQLFRGVTTNPPLSLQAIKDDIPRWEKKACEIIAQHPGIDTESLFWMLYKEVVRLGSEAYLTLFEKTGYKEGYLSGQVDPRSVFDKEAMLKQAYDIATINPNVMIKVPGTKEGYEVIEELTSKGIPTNNTLSFVMSQFVECAEAVKRGLDKARANNVDLSKWRSVITHMESRYGDLGGLRDFGKEVGIEVSEADTRWAELAIFKKACKFLKDNNYPNKMLSCSLRLGPTINGETRVWHLEEKVGAGIVVTCPPSFIDQIINFENQKNIIFEKNTIEREIPKEVMDKLMKIPYFVKGYAEDGYTPAEFNSHPALVRTADQFSKATGEMVAFAEKCLKG
ncbi:MAG: transaldolase [Deltaproteobacteria bacterium]|nr:MAG: transaldolase [Deltaproteobacteria bacterium]